MSDEPPDIISTSSTPPLTTTSNRIVQSNSAPNLLNFNSSSFLDNSTTIKYNNQEDQDQWVPPSPARSRSPSPFPPAPRVPSSRTNSYEKTRNLSLQLNSTNNREITTDLEKYLNQSLKNDGINRRSDSTEESYNSNTTEEGGSRSLSGFEERLRKGLMSKEKRNGNDDCSIHSAPELDTRIEDEEDETLRQQHKEQVQEEDSERGSDESVIPSPIIPSPTSSTNRTGNQFQRLPFSLWDYLQEEVLAVEMEGEEGSKSERVTNFLTVPGEVEKIILFGFVICLDSFLYTFTILPLRIITAYIHLLYNAYSNTFTRGRKRYLRLSHKCDLTKALMIIATLFILNRTTDASKMYHSVRGQETIKLYVIFNVLEIADRLCCSFGQDLQDSLFSRQTLGRRTDGSHPHLRPVALFALNVAYVVAHTLVLFYQLVTLNVAINSYSNALLTLLLSNQFVEIKGSVFKKFEKENLFQLTCADIVERFQLALMLFIIALRNLIELSSASTSSLFSFLPASFSFSILVSSLPTLSLLQTIFSPAIIVLLSECVVDWLKHAFITKFNHIRPAVYARFIDVLCKDLVVGTGRRQDQPFVDQSPLVSRRLGFAALPLGCLVVRVILQAFQMLADDSHLDECAPIPSVFSSSASSATSSSVTSSANFGLDLLNMTFSNLLTSIYKFMNTFFHFIWTLIKASTSSSSTSPSNIMSGGGNQTMIEILGLRFNGLHWEEFGMKIGGWAVLAMLGLMAWACLVALKLLIGINLRAFAAFRHSTMESRLPEDDLNGATRPRIGITNSEKVLAEPTFFLDGGQFDVAGKKKGKIGLSDLSRYDLIKSRLW